MQEREVKWGHRCACFISKKRCQKRSRARKRRKKTKKTSKAKILRFWQLTGPWPHLTLSRSDIRVVSWPRLSLMALDSLHLYFFCSSIQRSSKHLPFRRWMHSARLTSSQQSVPSPPTTTEAFNNFLVLDMVPGRPPFSVSF